MNGWRWVVFPTGDPDVPEYFEDTLKLFSSDDFGPLVRRQASSFYGREKKLLSSFLSEINSNLAFFDGHPGFAEVTAKSDFRFADLAAEPGTTVYLTIPLKEMHTSFRYLRAMIGCAFAAPKEQRDAEEASVLFILDEFAALRDMPFMRDAVAQMRSSGAWFWFFVQDVAQLEGVYDRWADVFLSQTDHQVFFGATLDAKTKKHVSSALGVTTFTYRDPNLSWTHSVGMNDSENATPIQLGGFGEGRNTSQTINITEPVVLAPRPLLTPFEVGTYRERANREKPTPAPPSFFPSRRAAFRSRPAVVTGAASHHNPRNCELERAHEQSKCVTPSPNRSATR